MSLLVRFAHQVELQNASIVMLDSIAGYRVSLRGEEISTHLHALCKYLQNMGVAVLLINEMESIVGAFQVSDIAISYLANTFVFLRYLELKGGIRRCIGVLKKRLSSFQRSLREIEMTIMVSRWGRPLTNLQGILIFMR